ncbi:MAG: hypothetical protein WCO69_05710 [Candidatus Omnitrophota bacterium]
MPQRSFIKNFWRAAAYYVSFAGLFFLVAMTAWGAGISVPPNSQLKVNGGILHVELANNSGDVVNAGIIELDTGRIMLNGSWTTDGPSAYLLGGAGTVEFTAATGTQFITPGSNINDGFFDLIHSGAADLELISHAVSIDGSFSNLVGTFKTNGLNMAVGGNWHNVSFSSFISGSATVAFDGGDQVISGETSFYNFTKVLTAAGPRTLTFPAGLQQKVGRLLMLRGFNDVDNLSLRSSTDTVQAQLSLLTNGIQDINAVNVKDNNASGGVTLIARGLSSVNAGNNANWQFGAVAVKWDGSEDTDWNNPFNWNIGLVPGPQDTAIVRAVDEDNGSLPITHQPVLTVVSPVTGLAVVNHVGALKISSGATLTLDQHDMIVTGTFTNDGTLVISGDETLGAASISDDGTFMYYGVPGSKSTITLTKTFKIAGNYLTTFNNLTIHEQASGPFESDSFTTDAPLTVSQGFSLEVGGFTIGQDLTLFAHNALTATGGTFTIAGDVSVTGVMRVAGSALSMVSSASTLSSLLDMDLVSGTVDAELGNIRAKNINIAGGTLLAPGTGRSFAISGDFTHSAGTFTHKNGTVVLDGASDSAATDQVISGDTSFYDVVKQVPASAFPGQRLTFAAGTTVTVGDYLTLSGGVDAAHLLLIRSTTGVAGNLKLVVNAGQSISNVDVANNAATGLTLIGRNFSKSSGNTPNWKFVNGSLTWDGSQSADWNDQRNWDLGVVPIPNDSVVITNGVTVDFQPALSSDVTVGDLALFVPSANLILAGHNITVHNTITSSGTLSNEGTIYLRGTESVAIDAPDVDSGLFVYQGDNVSSVKSITSLGPNTFYNLKISDHNGNLSNFTLTTDMTLHGSLTVDGGTLTASGYSMDITGDVSLTGGTFIAPGTGKTLFVGGNFSHSSGLFTNSSGSVSFNGSSASVAKDQAISGDTTFYEFIKQVPIGAFPGQKLTLAHGSTQTVQSHLVLEGLTQVDPLFIRSDAGGSAANLQLSVGGLQTIRSVDVRDNTALAVTLVARASPDNAALNNTNWIFGAPELKWDGSASTDWGDPLNWDLGLVPVSGDGAVIRLVDPLTVPPNLTIINQPVLTSHSGAVSLQNLTLSSGTTLTLDGYGLTVSGALTNDGNIIAKGSEAMTIANADTLHGTFTYAGDDTVAGVLTLSPFGALPAVNFYHDLVITDAGLPNILRSPAQTGLHVFGNLTVSSGELDVSTGSDSLIVDGNMLISSGASLEAQGGAIDLQGSATVLGKLSAPGAGRLFTIGGSWSFDPAATLTVNNGRVTFDTSNATTLSGNTSFYDLAMLSNSAKAVFFQAGSVQTVAHGLNLQGGENGLMALRSTVDGNPWRLQLSYMTGDAIAVPNTVAGWVDVKDSVAAGPFVRPFYITAINSVDQQVGGHSSNSGWIIIKLFLIAPEDNRVVGIRPVVIGQTGASTAYTIRDLFGNIVASGTSDSRGYFRSALSADLALGTNQVTPYYENVPGLSSDVTVDAAPTTAQVPVITLPSPGKNLATDFPVMVGSAKPNTAVYAVANNNTIDLPLTLPLTSAAGSSTADAAGHYSFALTTQLKRGLNHISIVSDGVSSAINTYALSDLSGYLFDATTNNPIRKAKVKLYKLNASGQRVAVDLTDIPPTQPNPVLTVDDGIYDGFYDFRVINLDPTVKYVLDVEEPGYTFPTAMADNAQLPAGHSIVVGSRGEAITLADFIKQIDLPVDANQFLFKVTKDVNKAEARIGDVVTYTVTVESLSNQNTVLSTKLNDIIPPGFKFMEGRVHYGDGSPVEVSGNRPLLFKTGTFTARQIKVLKYQLVIGAGVAPGDYVNTAFMKYDNGSVISNRANETVKVVMDPLFDAGTVFGKVFWDLNENGRQDPPEYDLENRQEIIEGPVPNVHLVMEDGTSITADKNGQFHIPGLLAGRHVVMLDQRSLPKGAFLTTEKAPVIDVTPGMPIKLNFGVNMGNDQVVGEDVQFFDRNLKIEQSGDKIAPVLNVDIFEKELRMRLDTVVKPVEFRIFMNYAPFISSWKLDIIDKDTKKLVREFNGSRYNINDPVVWDGRDATGRCVLADRKYAYLVKVQDEKGVWDETQEKDINVRSLTDLEFEALSKLTEEDKKKEAEARRKEYRAWQIASTGRDITAHRNIFVKGETLTVDPQETDIRQVRVLKSGELFIELPVLERQALTARGLLSSEAQPAPPMQIILPDGDYELEVVSADAPVKGASAPDTSALASASGVPALDEHAPAPALKVAQYRRPVKVGEDYMTFVALGDSQAGWNFNRGNIEPVASVDHFQPGFYQEGKMAYYLKGKIKGRYLLTSSFDSQRQQKEMFRSIKDDQYYPVYGDASTINYDATNTQGNLYLMLEWDKSQAIWGNYAVDFKDTEFARYSRTLYGGKLDYTSVATNVYGDPRTRVATFHAEVRQRSAHNEFLGTGGSLYYLKHQGVVVGTAKIHLEVRDAVTGQVRSTTEMKDGVDYDIDNSQGRILFWQPVAMSADSGRIISNQLLSGDPVYVVADYEFEVKDKMLEATEGVRVAQAVGRNVVLGGTYVSETQQGGDYQLKGQDVTVHVGRDTTVKAEYATTQSQDSASFVSTDGGITFSELGVGNLASGKAYGISQDSRLFDRLGLKSYYKWIENNFASASTSAQQGKAMSGLGLTFDLTPVTRLTASHDVQRLIEQGNLQTAMQVGAQETSTTVLQLVHDARRLRITGEYRHQQVTSKDGRYISESNQAQDTLALQAEYDLNEKTKLTSKYEVDPTGKAAGAGQVTTGITRQLTDRLSATVAESLGTTGHATKVGATMNVTPKMALSAAYQLAQVSGGPLTRTKSVSLTGKEQIGDKTSIQTNYTISQDDTGSTRMIVGVNAGSEVKLDDAVLKAGVRVQADDRNVSLLSQGAGLDASKTDKQGHTTSSSVKVDEVPAAGKVTTVTLGDKGPLAPGRDLVAEKTFAFGQSGEERGNTYKVVQERDGKKLETAYTRKLSDTQAQRSASNIFGLTGDVNDRVAANASLEQGVVQNIDGSLYHRTAISGGFGYLEKDEEGKEKLRSSSKAELRLDRGDHAKQQFVLYQDAQGKVNDQTTLSAKLQFSQTKDKDLNKVEAQYKEIILGAAYRPIMDDRLNLFAKYTYKENQGPAGQLNISDVEQTKMQVFSAEGAYDLNADWQLVEKMAYRMMEEKVAGFDFAKTHTWLLVNRANYRLGQDWKVGAEYRILTQQEARDRKSGFLVEAVRSINDNVELGVGYNFTDFVDDLTNLSYTVQGPFIRMSGKLYDRTPEERARAREKWLDRRIEIYAWKMVNTEFTRKDSPVVLEMNALYRMAQAASQRGQLEESRRLYKDVILATQLMYEEAANFVRQHISFEEKLYNASLRAREYYDKGELWAAKKLWEKIVEEAERSMLQ